MRLFRKWGKVCQNCKFGDNKKGKWIKKRFRNPWPEGHWHIYCTKKEKFYPWDKRKLCFKEKKKEVDHY